MLPRRMAGNRKGKHEKKTENSVVLASSRQAKDKKNGYASECIPSLKPYGQIGVCIYLQIWGGI